MTHNGRIVVGAVIAVALLAAVTALALGATRTHRGSMMGSSGVTMMMGSGGAMMQQTGPEAPAKDLAAARDRARRYADRFGLRVGEVMQFSNGYYAELDKANGSHGTEVLIDARSGAVWPEHGPAMMWNSEYGMMYGGRMMGGGMMGAGMAYPSTATRSVTAERAKVLAQRWLNARGDRLTAGAPETVPGYFTMHTMRDGKIAGMLSVNAATGAVWNHWWHGDFIRMTG